jgi:hypothetical protein
MATVPMVVYLWMTQILMISRCPADISMIHGWVLALSVF